MSQRREPIRSKALRKAAAGQPCTIEFVGICSHDPETTVLAHVHDETFGKSMKADDTSGVHACHSCHMAYDLHQTKLPESVVYWHMLRALQRTIRNLSERGILVFPHDPPPKPSTKPPKTSGRKIASKGFGTQHRPLQSRGFGK